MTDIPARLEAFRRAAIKLGECKDPAEIVRLCADTDAMQMELAVALSRAAELEAGLKKLRAAVAGMQGYGVDPAIGLPIQAAMRETTALVGRVPRPMTCAASAARGAVAPGVPAAGSGGEGSR